MDKITNSDGYVAVKYMRQVPKQVKVGGVMYVFMIRATIPMAWVHPDHVDMVLALKSGCCGQKKAGVFRLANESDVRRWTNNGGR